MNTKNNNKSSEEKSQVDISRKEALAKMGKYAAFTAAGMMAFYTPKKVQAASPPGLTDPRPFG